MAAPARTGYYVPLATAYRIGQCCKVFAAGHLPLMFALLMEPYAIIQVSILLQPHRTQVANFVPDNFSLFRGNPWQPHAEPWGSAEPQLKNTVVGPSPGRTSRKAFTFVQGGVWYWNSDKTTSLVFHYLNFGALFRGISPPKSACGNRTGSGPPTRDVSQLRWCIWSRIKFSASYVVEVWRRWKAVFGKYYAAAAMNLTI